MNGTGMFSCNLLPHSRGGRQCQRSVHLAVDGPDGFEEEMVVLFDPR